MLSFVDNLVLDILIPSFFQNAKHLITFIILIFNISFVGLFAGLFAGQHIRFKYIFVSMFHMEMSLKKNTMTEGKLRHSELSIVVHMNTQSKKINSDGSLNAKKPSTCVTYK